MKTPNDDLDQRTEALMNQGFELLDEEEYEQALEVARELEKLESTGAFEIAALAHDGMDDVEEAVRVLHRGVEFAPDCWPNWQLLGNYLSDLDRFEEAEAAYEQALDCDDVWEASVRLNQAILAGRREWFDKALALLDKVDDPELALQVAENRVANLNGAGRPGEAAALAEQTLAANREDEEHGDSLARIAALLGQIHLAAGEDKTQLRKFALTWLDVDPLNEDIFELIRDLDGEYADAVHYYWLFLHAKLPEEHPLAADAVGYFVSYGVIAENPQEALEFARRFEDEQLAPLLECEEIDLVEEVDSSEPKGVCQRTAMQLYESED
jgi:tetratricopeptide (TPR) repeat protein